MGFSFHANRDAQDLTPSVYDRESAESTGIGENAEKFFSNAKKMFGVRGRLSLSAGWSSRNDFTFLKNGEMQSFRKN